MPQITFHLLLKIGKRVKTQIVVKTLLVVSVASLDLAIVPRDSRADQFMLDLVTVTKHVERMCALVFMKWVNSAPLSVRIVFGAYPKKVMARFTKSMVE